MSEFCEPWSVGEVTTDSPCSNASIRTTSNAVSVHVKVSPFFGLPAANITADRVAACVNFCKHFNTEFLRTHRLYKADADDKGRTYLSDIPDFSGVVPCLPLVEAEKFEKSNGTL